MINIIVKPMDSSLYSKCKNTSKFSEAEQK